MTNKLAQALKLKAERRLERDVKVWASDPKMLDVIHRDYSDLIWIAILIEADFPDKTIQKFINRLDTIVRDEIPSIIYDKYFPNK